MGQSLNPRLPRIIGISLVAVCPPVRTYIWVSVLMFLCGFPPSFTIPHPPTTLLSSCLGHYYPIQ